MNTAAPMPGSSTRQSSSRSWPGAARGGAAAGTGAHLAIATPPINEHGSDAQRRRWLPPAIKGEKIVALGVTEPSGGSDIAHVQTSATRATDAHLSSHI